MLDVRPDQVFHQAHLARSYHVFPVSELKSRYSYLSPRGVPFLVLADLLQRTEVMEAFSSIPSARLVLLLDSRIDCTYEQEVLGPTAVVGYGHFFEAARQRGLFRTSRTHRDRIMGRDRENDHRDIPELLFRPSNAVRRTVLSLEASDSGGKPLRVLDLGCGAARDLAWILHGSRTRTSSAKKFCSWTGVGIDNWKAALSRAQQLMNDLCLQPASSNEEQVVPSSPHCEKLVWAKCSDDGFLEPLVGSGKGKSLLTVNSSSTSVEDTSLWQECSHLGLGPLLPPAAASLASGLNGDDEEAKFDLILCIRFHPRALLPRLPHLVRKGGEILLSHFAALSDAERETAIKGHPTATVDYDSPPHEGRIQPGEVESLVNMYNQTVEPGCSWTIADAVLEPIEDGRVIKSVALRKLPVET